MNAPSFGRLAHPVTAGLSPYARELIAEELMRLVVEIRTEANVWRAANKLGMETTIVTCAGLADILHLRAQMFRA